MLTPFYGKNKCNLLSNLIIKEYDVIDSNHVTSIKVTSNGHFYVLNGSTTISSPINYSKKFSEYFNDKLLSFNVIDLIEYNKLKTDNILFINVSHKKEDLLNIMDYNNPKLQGFFYIDKLNNKIISNNRLLYEKLIEEKKYSNYKLIKIRETLPFVSDDFFGYSLTPKKVYETYLKYISYNLFEKQLCNEINYNLIHEGEICDLNWETILFDIQCKNNIASDSWIKSMILDLFDFNFNHVKKHLSLGEYDFSNEILSKNRCWMLRDKTSEMFLL